MKLVIAILLAFCLHLSLSAQSGAIHGTILNDNTNEPLPFTNIIVWGTTIGSTSDVDGKFTLNDLQPGYVKLAASTVGFQTEVTEEFLVTNAKIANIEIRLKATTTELEAVVVRTSPFKRKAESPLSMRTLSISDIERNPGGNRDISKVIQSLPGVGGTVSFRNDVIVRGGGASENVFFLDEIEIPTINHFSTQGASGGPVGIINVDFIREVDFYSGAFPANRGDALSSMIEFRLVEGNNDRWNLGATLGASDLSLTADGPVNNNSTLIFSVRRSYLQLLFSAIGLPFLPTYNDAQFKYKKRFDRKNELTIIGLGAIDQFDLNTDIKDPTEEQQYILDFLPVNEQWSYTTGSTYKHYGARHITTIVLSRSALNNTSVKYKDNVETPQNLILDYASTENENKARIEQTATIRGVDLRYGAGGEFVHYENQTFQPVFGSGLDTIQYATRLNLVKWSLFGQAGKKVLDDQLSLSLGLRADANGYSKAMSNLADQLSPRFSASYELKKDLLFNFSVGRYTQLPAYTTMGYRTQAGALINKENGLRYLTCNQLVTGIELLPTSNTKFTVEAFYKRYNRYPFSANDSVSLANKGGDYGVYGAEEVTSTSTGRAYGLEFLFREKMYKGVNLLITYTLVRSEFSNIAGTYIPSAWDNRHLINLVVIKSLKQNWDLGLKWRLAGGAPYTPYNTGISQVRQVWDSRGGALLDYSLFNTLRLKPFHQLDIRIDRKFFFNKWSLMFYLDIQNVYNFKAIQPEYLVRVTDANGQPVILNPAKPYNEQQYQLKSLKNEAGTILPTLGIMLQL